MSGWLSHSVNRNVLSQVRKVSRDGADVADGSTPEGQRPKMLGCQQWSGQSEAGRGIAAGRAKLSATWKVSNAGERAAAVEDLAYEDCNLGCVQEHAEMKANERVRDEVKA